MFEPLLEAARKIDNTSLLLECPEHILPAVPDEFSLDHVRTFIAETHDRSDSTAVLSAIYVAIRSNKLASQPSDDGEYQSVLEDIILKVGRILVPICSGTTFDEDSTDYTLLSKNGLLGLHIIGLLLALKPGGTLVLPTETLLSIIAFTNPDDPWSSSSSAKLAHTLLTEYFKNISPPKSQQAPTPFPFQRSRDAVAERKPSEKPPKTEQECFITEDILTGFLRPLFARSRPATVTASGRPAAFPEKSSRYTQGDGFGTDDVASRKPWKYTRRYAVTLFEWSVANSNAHLFQEHWPLFTPVLLTLLDEPQPTSLRLRALSIFRDFWQSCPDGLLVRTGLAEVFEQAIFPTVLNLPSLTPEAESCDLLAAAYPALFDLAGLGDLDKAGVENESADAGLPNTADQKQSDRRDLQSKGFSESQRKLLDKIFREGIMVGYHHAKEHIRLVDFLCQTLCRLVSGMGILSIKYLKDIVPMISEILVDPFGTKYPPMLLSATHLLHAVLQTCWPRIPHYCNEIIRIVMLAWLNIEDEDAFPADVQIKAELKQQLIKTVEMLSAIMAAAKLDMSDRVCPLVAKEPQLRSLFNSHETR
ncbi:hypothetical protein F5B22DRAFT_410913 [Xylaria bambusicola]|uniref:uncharacterized protein n=1 Tax=Xylaria bambusicola TaxID=326684 RepID=UPI0020089708|nr:uncharacterized protein F5B22DRAFT_410913 [Xylaria bambusicola]KAI0523710.1 hypothetical protein F5B22DRAFT_410913 [Xylaria bambusicola]